MNWKKNLLAFGLAAATATMAADFNICKAPTTPDATESAQKLYSFLVNNFGTKTISGIMTGNMAISDEDGAPDIDTTAANYKTSQMDLKAVFEKSGKYPALLGLDLLNATGSHAKESWFKGYTKKVMALAHRIWEDNGIPAFSWHWYDPTDTDDAFYVKGADPKYTTFDFTDAFMTGTTTWDTLSTNYQKIVSDIDEVSQMFLELQDAGVAAIFRPIHESGGAWFWWSTHTGKQFAALYRLIYERMVFKNGVKNLVWVFNPKDAKLTGWTPGDTYYDVLSVDIYPGPFNNESQAAAFNGLTTNTDYTNTKIIALSENGAIPDVAKMHEDNAVWSWWMPWYQSWGGGFVDSTAADVWKSNMEDERIITLDKMPGWANYEVTNSATNECAKAEETSEYSEDREKAESNKKDYMMQVTYKTLTKDGANIAFTSVPDLSKAKKVSVEITNNMTGVDYMWFGLAFVKDGSADNAWTWEMSNSNDCSIASGATKTCEFDITTYKDDDGVEHNTDLANLFSVALMASGAGASGSVLFDNMIADDGTIITLFNAKNELFIKDANAKVDYIESITLVDQEGNSLEPSTPTDAGTDYVMAVEYGLLKTDAAQLILPGVKSLEGTKNITVTVKNNGSGAKNKGIWLDFAYLDGSYNWIQSISGCWVNDGEETDCEFATKYEVKDAADNVTDTLDMDLSSINTFIIYVSAEGFKGQVLYNNLYADDKVLSLFNDKNSLMKESEKSEYYTPVISSIYLANKDGSSVDPKTDAIKSMTKVASASKLSVAGNRVMLSAAVAGQVSVDVFSMSGKRVATLFRGNLNAGTHSFDMSDLSKGQYIVRVKGAGIAATQPVMIK